METFNILGHQISINQDFAKYIAINTKKNLLVNEYTNKYNLFKKNVTTIDELISYIENLKQFVISEYNAIADKIINILVNNQIYDKSSTDIISHNTSIKNFEYLISTLNGQIKTYLDNKELEFEVAKKVSAEAAQNSYDEYYMNVISTSAWDVIVNDTLNDIEATKIARKRQRLYDSKVRKAQNIINKEMNEFAQQFQSRVQELVYKGSLLIIDEMFIYCVNVLVLNQKLSNSVLASLNNEKTTNIINNLERIQDKNVMNEQLILALQSNPISNEIHSKILDNIQSEEDIAEYIKFIKFIKFENTALEICENNCLNLENVQDKYVKIINAINEKYIDSILSKANTIEEIENSNPSVNLSVSKKIFYMNYDKVFDTFVYTSSTIGKILEQDKIKGHIVVNLNNVLNPVRTDINIIRKNAIQTIVEVSAFCKADNSVSLTRTSQKWKEKLFEEVTNKFGIQESVEEKQRKNYEQQKLLYKKSKIKSTSKKILIIPLLLITLLCLLVSFPFVGIIMFNIMFAIILYPIIYIFVAIYYNTKQ